MEEEGFGGDGEEVGEAGDGERGGIRRRFGGVEERVEVGGGGVEEVGDGFGVAGVGSVGEAIKGGEVMGTK